MGKRGNKKPKKAIAEVRGQIAEVKPAGQDEVRPEVMEAFERVVERNRELLERLAREGKTSPS